ncbi:MAG: 6-carboxytetrahydropterin synthase QueD [bacterium]|nr:6-carboxytetrahydropterin synthase QueD [bacterium]
MYKLMVSASFAAAHQLRGYRGKCEALHGHNWRVQLYVRAGEVNEVGLAIDFKHLKKCLDGILSTLDHTNLNTLPSFEKQNPSSENIARYIFEQACKELQGSPIKVASVRVWESDSAYAEYLEQDESAT